MASIGEAHAEKLIEAMAKEMEKMDQITPPEWASVVKTGVSKERAPAQKNWWYVRSASVLRKIARGDALGVSRLRRIYGSRKRSGHRPEHKHVASGAVIRKILQQLEAAELVKTAKPRGRITTPKGKKFINDVSKKIAG